MCGCLGLWEERDKEWAELAEREREERGGRGGITAWGRRQTGREGTGSVAEASGGDFAEIPLSFGAAGAQERDGDGSDLALTCLFCARLPLYFPHVGLFVLGHIHKCLRVLLHIISAPAYGSVHKCRCWWRRETSAGVPAPPAAPCASAKASRGPSLDRCQPTLSNS